MNKMTLGECLAFLAKKELTVYFETFATSGVSMNVVDQCGDPIDALSVYTTHKAGLKLFHDLIAKYLRLEEMRCF